MTNSITLKGKYVLNMDSKEFETIYEELNKQFDLLAHRCEELQIAEYVLEKEDAKSLYTEEWPRTDRYERDNNGKTPAIFKRHCKREYLEFEKVLVIELRRTNK